MNFKNEGDKHLALGNYQEYVNNYKKYHNELQNETSLRDLTSATKKLELYKEMLDFLKKDENNYYEILNVKKDATQKEIRDSFTKLISKYHPDKTKIKESNSVSRIIHKAYVILSNTKKRQEYDDSRYKKNNVHFQMGEWNFTNQRFYQQNVFDESIFWNINNDEYTILNNILYRNFFRYTPNRRLTRIRWNEHIYLKVVILLLISYFILFI